MSKHLFAAGWCHTKFLLTYLLTAILFACGSVARAETHETEQVPNVMPHLSTLTYSQPSMSVIESTTNTEQPEIPVDPLNSPHPIPWQWIMEHYDQASNNGNNEPSYYRSSALISPDGQYAAYSRIKMHSEAELYLSRVSSVMFVENLRTGNLRTVTANSPLADHPLEPNEAADQPGAISILMPISWSADGDRILARQFESFFSTSDLTDYAVIWDKNTNKTYTIVPKTEDYSSAILLGWSDTNPRDVVFKAGNMGDEEWDLVAVNTQGDTMIAKNEQPVVYGYSVNQFWSGPQARWETK